MDITKRIDNYILQEDVTSLLELAVFMEHGNEEEMMNETVKKWLNMMPGVLDKLGIKIEKKNKGIIGVLKDSRKEIKEFFYHLFKAAAGNEESKKKVKEMAKDKVSKGDVIDVIIKLDAITFHFLALPIHTLEYLTGWKISGLRKGAENLANRIKGAIEALKKLANDLTGKEKKKVTNFTAELKRFSQQSVE